MKTPFWFYRLKGMVINTGKKWDKLAINENDAISFAHEKINPEPSKWRDEENYSLEYSLAHFGEYINMRLRDDRINKNDLEISEMIAKNITKTQLVLYRGVSKIVLDKMRNNAKCYDGVDLYEKSFLQTSLVKGHEINDEYHLRIYVPENTQAVYLGQVDQDYIDKNNFFYEVDLQRGAKLKIVSIDKEYINCKLLSVNVN